MFLKIKMIWFVMLLLASISIHSVLGMEFMSQEDLDQFVGTRAVELYGQLNKCSRYQDLTKGERKSIPGDNWEIVYQNGVIDMYKKHEDVGISEALNQIFENKENIIECTTASYIVYAKILSDIFGDLFDDVFYTYESQKKGKWFSLRGFIGSFCKQLDHLTIKNVSQPGALVLFRNFPNYTQLNRLGAYNNDNLLTVKTDHDQDIQYIGFGKEFENGPLSYDAVRKYMIDSYTEGTNQTSTLLIIDTIIRQEMGFEEHAQDSEPSDQHPSFHAVKKYIEEAQCNSAQLYPNRDLQETVFDFIQVWPVLCLSFEEIQAEKKYFSEDDSEGNELQV